MFIVTMYFGKAIRQSPGTVRFCFPFEMLFSEKIKADDLFSSHRFPASLNTNNLHFLKSDFGIIQKLQSNLRFSCIFKTFRFSAVQILLLS